MEGAHHVARRLFAARLRPHRRRLGVLTAVLLAGTLLPLVGPALIGRFIDRALAGATTGALLTLAGLYLLVAVTGRICLMGATYAASSLAWDIGNDLRAELVEHVLGLDMAFHGQHAPGQLLERVDGDVDAVSLFFSSFVTQVVGAGVFIAGVVVAVSVTDPLIGAALIGWTLVGGYAVARATLRAIGPATADREAAAELFGGIEERIVGIEDLRANGGSQHAIDVLLRDSRRSWDAGRRAQRASARVYATASTVIALAGATTLALGVVRLQAGLLTVGTVYVVVQYTRLIRQPLEMIANQLKLLQQAVAGAARTADLLEQTPDLPPGGSARLPDGPLPVTFAGVSFGYGDGTLVLDGLDLEIAPGEVVGLVGRTGAGKTTVARLVLRFYDPTAGSIRVAGLELPTVATTELRRRIAYVTQDVQLFRASLRDNLTVFAPADRHPDAELTAVLERLELGAWYRALPDGLDTLLGDDGVGTSAGEAQLLALARAFLRDPGIVVLDEASSRLDPETEARIERAVDTLLAGRTAIVIAHRTATLARADRVLRVEHGTVSVSEPTR